jgi:hypothetical protein
MLFLITAALAAAPAYYLPDDVAAAIRHRPDDFLTYPELRKCDV